MPKSQSRTTDQIDRELSAARNDRAYVQAEIDQHLQAIRGLRTRYARAGSRMDQLLEERLTATS